MTQMGIDNINALLDSFMGINDSELAEQVWLDLSFMLSHSFWNAFSKK